MNVPETWWEFAVTGPHPIVPVEVHRRGGDIFYVKRPRSNGLQRVWRRGQIHRTYEKARDALIIKLQADVKDQKRLLRMAEDRLIQVTEQTERNPYE